MRSRLQTRKLTGCESVCDQRCRRLGYCLRLSITSAWARSARTSSLCDTKGVVYQGRSEGMNPYKQRFALDTPLRTLAQALEGADVFAGLSAKLMMNWLVMVRSMAPRIRLFLPWRIPKVRSPTEEAGACRDDVIISTGRSDYPNQGE